MPKIKINPILLTLSEGREGACQQYAAPLETLGELSSFSYNFLQLGVTAASAAVVITRTQWLSAQWYRSTVCPKEPCVKFPLVWCNESSFTEYSYLRPAYLVFTT
jgi:hypothetical protein